MPACQTAPACVRRRRAHQPGRRTARVATCPWRHFVCATGVHLLKHPTGRASLLMVTLKATATPRLPTGRPPSRCSRWIGLRCRRRRVTRGRRGGGGAAALVVLLLLSLCFPGDRASGPGCAAWATGQAGWGCWGRGGGAGFVLRMWRPAPSAHRLPSQRCAVLAMHRGRAQPVAPLPPCRCSGRGAGDVGGAQHAAGAAGGPQLSDGPSLQRTLQVGSRAWGGGWVGSGGCLGAVKQLGGLVRGLVHRRGGEAQRDACAAAAASRGRGLAAPAPARLLLATPACCCASFAVDADLRYAVMRSSHPLPLCCRAAAPPLVQPGAVDGPSPREASRLHCPRPAAAAHRRNPAFSQPLR